jgi:hypothetical protein
MGGLIKFFQQLQDPNLPPHVIIPLLGRFKNEIGARFHLTLLASCKNLGINIHLWIS